jgi:hypothetical protein
LANQHPVAAPPAEAGEGAKRLRRRQRRRSVEHNLAGRAVRSRKKEGPAD